MALHRKRQRKKTSTSLSPKKRYSTSKALAQVDRDNKHVDDSHEDQDQDDRETPLRPAGSKHTGKFGTHRLEIKDLDTASPPKF